jgi:mono/diheme cytochrome c family protein
MLKPLFFASALVLFGISTTSNAGPLPQQGGQADSAKLSDKALTRTKGLYTQECALCHGDTGDGKTDVATGAGMKLDDWTDPKTLAGKSDQELFGLIRNGKGQMTPEPVGRASDVEVRNLIQYIRALAKQKPAATPEAPPVTPPAEATPPAAATPPATN